MADNPARFQGPNAPPLTSGRVCKGRTPLCRGEPTWRKSLPSLFPRGNYRCSRKHLAPLPPSTKNGTRTRNWLVRSPASRAGGHVSRINGRVTPVHCGLGIPFFSAANHLNQKPGCRSWCCSASSESFFDQNSRFPGVLPSRIVRHGFTIGLPSGAVRP